MQQQGDRRASDGTACVPARRVKSRRPGASRWTWARTNPSDSRKDYGEIDQTSENPIQTAIERAQLDRRCALCALRTRRPVIALRRSVQRGANE